MEKVSKRIKQSPIEKKSEINTSLRSAGVLLHITSLSSNFGIGDFGPQAKAFADFLEHNHQQYWQLLPLSQTGEEQGYSPYSSTSSMAGNTLLISPDLLAEEKLLDKKSLSEFKIPNKGKVNFKEALRVKTTLLEKAYEKFKSLKSENEYFQFEEFCNREAYWLDNYALYTVIKQKNNSLPWYQWPQDLKLRELKTILQFSQQNEEGINKEKWLQYIFFKQWKELKKYCNDRGIKIFGDLPFYVSYDSVDVWSNPEIFSLDEEGALKAVAGVPPDYFNADGQLWGMPVFCWDVLKDRGYDWWIKRIKKNIELYDLLRFDHFRAFASYWEVEANEKTAINGTWKPGPGSSFFKTLKKELDSLPFVAEDLGDIDEAVTKLRDEFKLPGMKVLQFAFSDDLPKSNHIPHNFTSNFIVYTGTHDNNTSVGWFRKDADSKTIKHLRKYAGRKITEKNIHVVLSKMAYASVAKIVIIPFQDVMGLTEKARINTPSSTTDNWQWRLKKNELESVGNHFLKWTRFYNRSL